ncbi:uncharacterized protein [Panulirus ornatus]|uniref:uncharacterized protein n=1 Tax=Panulirus ornatus TaxID=150431 RepID=UPI003A8A31AC
MARRGPWSSLESRARIQAAKTTVNAIKNVSTQEKFEFTHDRKRDKKYKRKRSYSCGDDEEQELTSPKKVRTEDNFHHFTKNLRNKRTRHDVESKETPHGNKRPKLDENCEKCDNLRPASYLNICQAKCVDDIGISYYNTNHVMFNDLKEYFMRLSPRMWSDYGKSVVCETLREIRLENMDGRDLKKTVEYILCEKLVHFSTATIESFPSELEGVIYDKLKHCRRLTSLEITVVPRDQTDVVNATLSLPRLRHLQSLSLLPPTRYSFHWAVGEVAQHCAKLRELKVVYNGDRFADSEGIACLGNRLSLVALWLFNFGRKSESRSLTEVLRSLPNLKILFHKELPNVILELTCESGRRVEDGEEDLVTDGCLTSLPVREAPAGSRQLGLERVDLCWYQRGVGYQLVYVPSSYLLRVAQACPRVKLLNLVGPPCLAQVIASLPHLQVVVLQQASLTSCLRCTLKDMTLDGITELRVSDVWDVTHDLISAVACACSSLRVLSVVSSSLEAQGDLLTPRHRPSFPCLREATLVPTTLQGRPSLTSPAVWQLGAALTSYLLRGASLLTYIHLQYKRGDIPDGDVPSEQELEEALCHPRPALRQLILEWPPAASHHLVWRVMQACPALTTLGGITTWPLTAHQSASLVAHYGRLLDIM